MSVTIHDVARRAGVSNATVSRVLNNTCRVREDKRRQVIEAARALGYSPNPAALSLLNKRTGGIGVLLPYVSGEFYSEILGGLDEAAQEDDRFLVISTSHSRPEEFQRAIQVLDKRVDGLIVMAPELDTGEMGSLIDSGTPVVFVNTAVDGLAADVFNFDNVGGTHAMTEHLLGGGHRRIAYIAGPPSAGDARARGLGYRQAMAEAGILDTSALEVPGGYTRELGFEAAEAILATRPWPTAIVAANDHCALGVVSALHTRGIAVPDEIAVAGFDGLSSSEYAVPALSTIRVPIRDIGYRAARRLSDRLRGDIAGGDYETHIAPVELVIRESTRGGVPA